MTAANLHYIFDPFCGWCYGAAPLVDAMRDIEGLQIAVHGGGMMAGAGKQRVTPALRNFVVEHDRRIAQMSGQPFSDAYRDGLLRDETAVFDSEPPTTAILVAEKLGERGLDMLKRIQQAHFVEGLKVADPAVLQSLAVDIGIDARAFSQAFAEFSGDATRQHISTSRSLLGQVGGQGFPTFALMTDTGVELLDFGRYLGRPAEWKAWLAGKLKPVEA